MTANLNSILWLLLPALGIYYWWDSLRSREVASRVGRHACQQAAVQFLDETVRGRRLRLRRNSQGRLQLQRSYVFEFTSDGAQRYEGRIVLLGKRLQTVEMDIHRMPPD